MRSRFFLSIAICAALAVLVTGQSPTPFDNEPRLPQAGTIPLDASEALIQRARRLANSGGHRESAEAWKQTATNEPALATFARRERVRELLAAGDLQTAFSELEQLGGSLPSDLLLRAAAAGRAAGMLDRAATLYRQSRAAAGRTPDADEAALGLAATQEQNGEPREALETLRDLQLTFREASAYDRATDRANRLSTLLQDPAPLTEQDYDAIVDRLASAAAFQRAIDVQREWKTRYPETARARQIDAAIVQNLYSLRANQEARDLAEAFLKNYPDSTEAHNVAITLFRLEVREGHTADVDRRGRAILSGQPQGITLGDRQGAARLLAEYLVSIGQPTRALEVYDQLYTISRTRGDRVDVLWRTAIASLRAGNRPRAIRELKQVLGLKPDAETERAATFWLAYTQDLAGAKTVARALWAGLVKRYPFSFYGVRSATRLDTGLPEPSLSFPVLTLRDAVMAHPDFKAASLLSRAGLLPEAAVLARRLSSTFRRDAAVALLAARASEAAGDHSSASTLMASSFGEYLQRPAMGLPDDFWTLAFPKAFWPAISAAASRHNVDPLLMLGLARQESHFDPTARSPVGAIGLFQLMPYTAAEIDPSFAVPGATARLMEPAVSAELGAAHLEQHLALYGGAVAPTVASYNADSDRVQVWWNAAKGQPEELFIDSIPYRETRAYVRQVLANLAMYQRTSAPGAGAQSASPRR